MTRRAKKPRALTPLGRAEKELADRVADNILTRDAHHAALEAWQRALMRYEAEQAKLFKLKACARAKGSK